MTELRAILLPAPAPLRLRQGPGAFADAALRPIARGMVFLAALSLPVLGCLFADRFHGEGPRSAQAAVSLSSLPGTATFSRTGANHAPSRQALLTPAKFAQSLSLQ